MELDALSWTQCASAEIHSSSQTLEMDCPMSCGVCVRLKTMPTDLRANIQKLNAGYAWVNSVLLATLGELKSSR